MDLAEQGELIGKLLLSAFCGALIGGQRDRLQYVAGLRTMALVAIGASLFTGVNDALGVDRVASNIVTGIGFLGAGIIFRDGATVRGITTAATIWSVAAIGVAIGAELYLLALVATPLVFVILEMRPLSEYLSGQRPRMPLPNVLRRKSTSRDEEDEGTERQDG